MKRKQTVLEVRILQDPVLGWGHEADDHKRFLESYLNSTVPHYKPEVKVLREETVEVK